MSIFSRIKDLFSASVNDFIDKAEDPEKMANEYLRQLNEQYYEAKTSIASAMASEKRIQQKLSEAQAEVDKWQEKAETALRAGDEELARSALKRKSNAQKIANQYEAQHKAQSEQVDKLQDTLADIETRIGEMKAKRQLISAKQSRAQSQEAIYSAARKMSDTSPMEKFEQLEDRVDDQVAEASARAELESGSLDNRFRDLETEAEVDDELAEMKKKLGM
jgi:phage shock protein A